MKLIYTLIFVFTLSLNAEELSYSQLLEEFDEFDISDSYYEVKDVFFQKDVGKFVFTEGTIYPFTPIDGDTIGFFFDGKGKFIYSNTDPVETSQLERFYESKFFMEDFSRGIFIFPISEWRSFVQYANKENKNYKLNFAKKNFKGKKSFLKYHDETLCSVVAHQLLNRDRDYFFSALDVGFAEDMVFYIDPLDDEEVTLGRGYYIRTIGNYYYPICKTKSIKTMKHVKDILDVLHYDMDLKIDNRLRVSNKIKMTTVIKEDSPEWIEFRLMSKLLINSIKNENGKELDYYKNDKSGEFWVNFGKDYSAGDTTTIEMDVYGDIFFKGDMELPTLFSSMLWYPHWDYKDKATFDIRYTYSNSFVLVSGGDLQEEKEIDNMMYSHWIQKDSVRNFSFNLGNYDKKQVSSSKVAPYDIDVYYKNLDQLDAVVAEIKSSLGFYTELYGKLDIDHIKAAHVHNSGGEAFKGMINLFPGSFYFGNSWSQGSMESLTAHEIAHQWWGISVDYETYHDQWISEAFAEYSSLLFLQIIYQNNDLFFRFLNDYREDLLKARNGLLFDGVKPGPVYLGYRNETATTSGDYSLIVYKKGAWVLHMLRNMLMDIQNLDDRVFFDILKEFYQQNKNSKVKTEDFIKYIEYKLVVDLQWFFDQWVYGTDIPKYTYSFKKVFTQEDKCKVKLYIKQNDVPSDFKASIPVTFKFDDGKIQRYRVFMTGEEVLLDFPASYDTPSEFVFNDFFSVLCEAEKVDWEDEFEDINKTDDTKGEASNLD